jgi:hypothetical protein
MTDIEIARIAAHHPAFPKTGPDQPDTEHGITRREYYAAKALQGLLSADMLVDIRKQVNAEGERDAAGVNRRTYELLAALSFEIADAMVERSKR